ncbi:MAG: MotA/TolQ/ExbB proton channel family protein [Polyangiaceae bacterium]|nr:MotA/TolQ/ExbB proton channel family protein [Polyangiaceae bacterium]
MQFTLTELWGHMGLFARLVVIAMAIMSVISVIVVAERLLFYTKSKKDSLAFAEKLAPLLSKGDLDEAATKAPKANQGHLGRVLYAGLTAYKTAKSEAEDIKESDEAREMVFESVARALERQSQREVAILRRGNSWLGTVGATVPFIGLLGTVMGIVTAFQQMAASGSGGLGTVSAGIAEALITTAFGLLVAIPAVMAYNFLSGWVDGRAVDISESSNELLDVVARRLHITFKRRAAA